MTLPAVLLLEATSRVCRPPPRAPIQSPPMTSTLSEPRSHSHAFDPEQYRMTVGEHLEELRRRLILGLAGFAVVLVFCLIFGQRVMTAFCAPLFESMLQRNLNPQLYYTE